MQVSPALPWSSGQGGTIRLATPIQFQDIINGILKFEVDYEGQTGEAEFLTDMDIEGVPEGAIGVYFDGEIYCYIESFEGTSSEIVLHTGTFTPDDFVVTNIEFSGVIPISGDIQIFADQGCTQYATGTSGTAYSTVFARINTPWEGDDSGWEVDGGTDGTRINCQSPMTDASYQSYSLTLWVDFLASSQQEPYNVGQIVALSAETAVDITGYQTIFTKP